MAIRNRLHAMSISTRTALSMAAVLALLVVVMAIFAFQDERDEAVADSLARLDRYNQDLVLQEERRFLRISETQRRARQLFLAERAALDEPTARRLLNQLYPQQADGTRRSTDQLFTGGHSAIGLTRGMAGFIPAGLDRNGEAVRDIIAATRAVHALGEGSHFDLESLYFFTPDNAIIIFAPDRSDKLLFYRKHALPDFSFQDREFATISTRSSNPSRRMRCTGLQSLISEEKIQTWTTGCMTPVDRNGSHIGTFGTSMPLHEIVRENSYDNLHRAQVILVSREGRLIRHPEYTLQNERSTGEYLDLSSTREPKLKALWKVITSARGGQFIGYSPGMSAVVSVRTIPTPGWHAIMLEPESKIQGLAMRPVARIAITAVITLLIVALITTFVLRNTVGKPLRRLAGKAERITRALADDQLLDNAQDSRTRNEVTLLVARFEMMAAAIRQSYAVLEQRVSERTWALNLANEQLKCLSEIDALTNVANRRKIMADLESRIDRMGDGGALAVMLLDVDHFKAVNDQFGHIAGDDALCALAGRIKSLLRPGDALGRIGGEEFLIILDRARPVIAEGVAERIRAAVKGQKFDIHGGKTLSVTISIGLASWIPGETVKDVYARADAALYEAKKTGRNCVMTSHSGAELRDRAA